MKSPVYHRTMRYRRRLNVVVPVGHPVSFNRPRESFAIPSDSIHAKARSVSFFATIRPHYHWSNLSNSQCLKQINFPWFVFIPKDNKIQFGIHKYKSDYNQSPRIDPFVQFTIGIINRGRNNTCAFAF